MYYVYRIRSRSQPDKSFLGTSRDVKKRLRMHNSGQVEATREHGPWKLTFYAAFPRQSVAKEFQEFLKTTKGKSFGRNHLWKRVEDSNRL